MCKSEVSLLSLWSPHSQLLSNNLYFLFQIHMENNFKMYRDQCHWLSSLFGLSTLQSFMIRPILCYTRLLYIQVYHDPCLLTYYSVEAKQHYASIWKNTNNNNKYNLKYTLITPFKSTCTTNLHFTWQLFSLWRNSITLYIVIL